jgi:hypothetical protein
MDPGLAGQGHSLSAAVHMADLSVDDWGILNPATPEDLAGLGEPGMVRQIRRIIGVCHRLNIATCQC